ncbi:cytochrome c oxidase subunit II [Fulvivirga kasyanovii]|uniref:Cytochrome c oxidase subunit 2 n=1 Tax=Fulvivirga kasyanovii TaxID=396812 RepID=A0ABW9RX63_9BACT|nr:cytochrome c oxidase subunit II [Fulvivirga kasyanovii]MTI27605.1 cytochrome c oxidase subunit II [Fulvivirga kasyanovii]
MNKETRDRIDRTLSFIQPWLLLGFIIIFVPGVVFFTFYYSDKFLPYPVSEHGREIVPLFNTTTILTGLAFFLTQILLFFFAFRYRKKVGRQARYLKNFLKLELFWTVIPALAFIFLFVWGQILWAKIQAEPEGDVVEIDVMGEQFNWWVRYPGQDGELGRSGFEYIDQVNHMGIDFTDPGSLDDFIPMQIHIPKGRPVKLHIRTRDVIHSFFLPHFRVKMDAVPGMITKVNFTATTTTAEMREKLNDPTFNYEVACAELCGRMHFAMKMILVVDTPEEYGEWLKEQKSWLSQHPEYRINYTSQ